MAQSFIFGGNTGLSYDQIQKQRDIANELLRANMSTPQNVGEGLSAIGRALAAKAIDKRTTRADEANRAAYEAKRGDLFGAINGSLGGATPASYAPAPQPTAGEAVANDTMSVLGNFGALEGQYGLPAGYLDRTYAIESGGNPNAKNPNSSAEGPFQFIDSTAAQYGLTDKTDLGASAAAAARLAADNKAILTQALGREPTAGELYLAHQQGGAGAAKLLANPNARAVDIVGPDAVTLNGGNPNMTASEFAGKWVQKFGGGAPAQSQGQPPINPAILMQLAEIQGNPYASESDKAIANVLMGQVTQAMDPMRQMEMERTRLELDQMKNPQPGFKNMTDEEEKSAGLDTSGVYQQGADGKIAVIQEPAKPQSGFTTLTDDQEKTMGLDTAGLYQVDGEGKIYTIQEPAKPAADPNSVREYNFYAQQETAAGRPVKSYDEWKTSNAKAGAASVTVGGENTPGLGKLSADYTYETNPDGSIKRDASGLPIAVPIPGSPAAQEAAKIAAAKAKGEDAKMVEADVITNAAQRAREAAQSRDFGPYGSSVVGWMNPQSDSGEVIRQVNTLKSNGTFAALSAMRAASPTGAALGAASDRDLQLLAEKAGALDPSSKYFLRDLDDYERTLLRTIYGKEEGDRAFEASRQGATAPDADGWQIINGVKVRVKQ